MREAVSIAPDNQRLRDVFTNIQRDDTVHNFLKICRRYAAQPDEAGGDDIYRYLQNEQIRLPPEVADHCIPLLFETCTSQGARADEILSSLLRQSSDARVYLAAQLTETTTDTIFEKIWNTGDGSVYGLVTVALDTSAWSSEETRERCERDIFMLFFAKLMEAGQDHMERGMRGLARLLVADAEHLHSLVDAEALEVILPSLDPGVPAEIRSQAIVITTKYLEASQATGEQLLSDFITTRVYKATNDNLVVAFSVAATVFPIMRSTASQLFLTEGFVQSVIGSLIKRAKSGRVKQAALEMFNAACIDRNCRVAIKKHCSGWLEEQMNAAQEPSAGTAAVVLSKIQSEDTQSKQYGQAQQVDGVDQLVDRFRDMMRADDTESQQRSIEGLAFTSLKSAVKDELAHDKSFFATLANLLSSSSRNYGLVFGGLTILVNLTKYIPRLSDEQRQMSQLKAYANTSKTSDATDTLDNDEHVTSRCKAVLESNVVPVLVTIYKDLTANSLKLMLICLLSLSKEQKHRGLLVQQGAVKLLLQVCTSTAGSAPSDEEIRRTSAHALARILISVDPNLVFGSSASSSISSAIPPLLSLLEDESISDGPQPPPQQQQRDLLPSFEALLALTNIASTADPNRDSIIWHGWPRIEDLLLSHNTLVQRGAVELVCNLMASPECIAKFADGSARASTRLHILLALADVDDVATRRAAGGALAMLTGWDAAVEAVLKRDRGVKILLGLCADEDEEGLRHRGIVCVRNIICASGQVGRAGIDKVKEEGGAVVLREMLKQTTNPEVLEVGVEALKMITN